MEDMTVLLKLLSKQWITSHRKLKLDPLSTQIVVLNVPFKLSSRANFAVKANL